MQKNLTSLPKTPIIKSYPRGKWENLHLAGASLLVFELLTWGIYCTRAFVFVMIRIIIIPPWSRGHNTTPLLLLLLINRRSLADESYVFILSFSSSIDPDNG